MADRPPSAYTGDQPYVFVSYAHEDEAAVFSDIRRLQDDGIDVWFDEGISPGSEWSEAIAERIQGCTRFLYFITAAIGFIRKLSKRTELRAGRESPGTRNLSRRNQTSIA